MYQERARGPVGTSATLVSERSSGLVKGKMPGWGASLGLDVVDGLDRGDHGVEYEGSPVERGQPRLSIAEEHLWSVGRVLYRSERGTPSH